MLVKDLFEVITKFFEETNNTDCYNVHIVDIEFDEEYTTNVNEINNGIFNRNNSWGLYHIENWEFDGKTFKLSVSWSQFFKENRKEGTL